MSKYDDDLAALDDELAELKRERDKYQAEIEYYRSPEQVEARRAARVRIAGEVLMQPLPASWLAPVRAHAARTDEGYLFDDDALRDDGVKVLQD